MVESAMERQRWGMGYPERMYSGGPGGEKCVCVEGGEIGLIIAGSKGELEKEGRTAVEGKRPKG